VVEVKIISHDGSRGWTHEVYFNVHEATSLHDQQIVPGRTNQSETLGLVCKDDVRGIEVRIARVRSGR
jgi:hypothetical protein